MKAPRHLRKSLRGTEGFSLIEVVLALSIVAVGLITIIGLFPQGLTSAKNAVDDSMCGMIAQDAIASRKIDIQTGVSKIGDGAETRWYMGNGSDITSSAVVPTNATFQVIITGAAVPGLPNSFNNVENTQVQIVWPWFSSLTSGKIPPPPNTNTFYTEITKY